MVEENVTKLMSTIEADPDLEVPSIPVVPVLLPKYSIKTKISVLQDYISALEYNYTGTNYFDLNKNRSFKSIVSTAKLIITESLPIQCLEAVFLGAYLTSDIDKLDRIPLSFKSAANGQIYRHIVLVLRYEGLWGSIGLSRSNKLMYKEIKYKSFGDLISEFNNAYSSIFHELRKIYIGFPFRRDIHSSEKIEWRMLNMKIESKNMPAIMQQIDLFGKEYKNIQSHYLRVGEIPKYFNEKFTLHIPSKKETKLKKNISASNSPTKVKSIKEPKKLSFKPKLGEIEVPLFPISVKPPEIVFRKANQNSSFKPINIFLQNTTSRAIELTVKPPPSKAFGLIIAQPNKGAVRLCQNPVELLLDAEGVHSLGLQFFPTKLENEHKSELSVNEGNAVSNEFSLEINEVGQQH